MKTATIPELKQELQAVDTATLVALCLRLARFRKENKELLTYLLFEAHDGQAYINGVKELIAEEFTTLPETNLYFTKKRLRKILRLVNKYSRYAGSKQAETELLLYFCTRLKNSGIPLDKGNALTNLYQQQLKKIHAALLQLHEDLQYDYRKELDAL
ncbi:MAG: hypothetical protein NVSMB63_03450 [Sediminibacterium sp.]